MPVELHACTAQQNLCLALECFVHALVCLYLNIYRPVCELLLHICSLNDVDVSFLNFPLWHVSLPESLNSEPVVNALRRENVEIFELL